MSRHEINQAFTNTAVLLSILLLSTVVISHPSDMHNALVRATLATCNKAVSEANAKQMQQWSVDIAKCKQLQSVSRTEFLCNGSDDGSVVNCWLEDK